MKKLIIPLLLIALLLTACGEKDLGTWEMPTVDAAPTTAPTTAPSFNSYSGPESYVWNEATAFNMSDPGVGEYITPVELSHSSSLALFGSDLLPSSIFTESRSQYTTRSLKKATHEVLLDSDGALLPNAYVEYTYLTKSGREDMSVAVMAELCDHDTLLQINTLQLTPHVQFAEDVKPKFSSYYLNSFLLFKVGDARYAQVMVLPSDYFSRVAAMESSLAEGEELSLPRQVVLTFTCGEAVSDEEFIAAVVQIWNTGSGNAPEPVVVTDPPLQMGDKGFA